MATAVEINTLRRRNGQPLIRYDLRKLAAADLIDLRQAWETMVSFSDQQVGDRRGYFAVARGHGYDQDLCHNEPRLFLPWHRSYVYALEKRLTTALRIARNDQTLVITLPYWDWAVVDATTDDENGIPRALSDEEYVAADGSKKPNPLKQQRSLYRVEALKVQQVITRRYPASFRGKAPALAQMAADAFENQKFAAFNDTLDTTAHGAVHFWLGGQGDPDTPNGKGDMGSVVSAAYDPIFWFHHCYVDKLWFDWQARFGNQTFPPDLLGKALFEEMTVPLTLEPERELKYTYGTDIIGATGAAATVATGSEEAPLPPTMRVALGTVTAGFRVATLELQGVKPPKDSVEVRVFLDQEDADQRTPTQGNPRYAGSLYLFGHGHCFGAPGHCNPRLEPRDAYDLRPAHPLKPRTYRLDIAAALRRLVAATAAGPTTIELAFVVVDALGRQVPPGVVDFDSLSVVTR
jgi:tyrosinase